MKRLIISLLTGLVFTAAAEDWSKWLGPYENGKTNEVLPDGVSLSKIAWEADLGIGFSSFSVASLPAAQGTLNRLRGSVAKPRVR